MSDKAGGGEGALDSVSEREYVSFTDGSRGGQGQWLYTPLKTCDIIHYWSLPMIMHAPGMNKTYMGCYNLNHLTSTFLIHIVVTISRKN